MFDAQPSNNKNSFTSDTSELSANSKEPQQPSQSDTPRLTILRALDGKKCAKVFYKSCTKKYDKAAEFEPKEVAVENFVALVDLLKGLENQDDCLVVMGRITPPYRSAKVMPRRKKYRDGVPASLEDAGAMVAHFDLDDEDIPDGFGWQDPASLARATWEIVKRRVPALEGVSVYWQASSSAGTQDAGNKAKFHFWVLLDRPLFENQRRELYQLAGSDKQLACPIQPHYTAAPIFVGVPDPLSGLPRSGVIHGERERVRVDNVDLKKAPTPVANRKSNSCQQGSLSPAPSETGLRGTWGERQLELACQRIVNAEQRNVEINRQAYFIGGAVAADLLSEDVAFEQLKKAAENSGHDRHQEALENGFRDGLQSPLEWNDRPAKPTSVPAYFPASTRDRQETIEASRLMIANWVKDAIAFIRNEAAGPAPRVMQWGTQGIGKTSQLVGPDEKPNGPRKQDGEQVVLGGQPGGLHKATGLISAMFLPGHAKCEETADVYRRNAPVDAPPCLVVRGRNRPDPDGSAGQKMCLVPELAEHVARQGYTVRSTLCLKCPLRKRCGYLRQERMVEKLSQSDRGVVLFAPHEYAFLPLPAEVSPDLVVFDEAPGDRVLEKIPLSLDDLKTNLQFGGTRFQVSEKTRNDMEADAIATARDLVKPMLKSVLEAFDEEHGLCLDTLRIAGIGPASVDAALNALYLFSDKRVPGMLGEKLSGLNADMPVEKTQRFASGLAGLYKPENTLRIDHLRLFLEVLKSELATAQSTPTAIVPTPGKLREFHVVRLRKLMHGADTPFLHIDGTGDPELAKIMFGADLVAHRFSVERNAKVTQVVGNKFSSKYVLGQKNDTELVEGEIAEKSERLRQRIRTVLDRHSDAAVFASKKIREALGLAGHARAGHFNALRGLNSWKAYKTAIIIGREQPPLQDVELTARAFAARLGRSLRSSKPVWEWRGIRTGGEPYPVSIMTHPDPIVEKVLHQMREAELAQALDRIRLIHNQEPKEVFLLNEIAVDVTVDKIIQWRDFWPGGTRVDRASKDFGFVPLNGREATLLLPSIWSNHETANKDLKPLRLVSDQVYEELLYTNPDSKILCHVRYKRSVQKPQRAHWREAIVFSPGAEAQAVLERVAGKLGGFEVLSSMSR